jgi:hypothetical protein
MEVNQTRGRKVFTEMLTELKLFYDVFTAFHDSEEEKYGHLNDDHVYNIAYLSFFFGVGEKSTPLVIDLIPVSHAEFTLAAHQRIRSALSVADTMEMTTGKRANYVSVNIERNVFEWERVYTLGVGHLRRLSHYIRHLFQIVKFVDEQPEDFLPYEKKYTYITHLRSQLSVHEQILLYYNALSVLGEPWLETSATKPENYIEKYCMLKSMPLNAADFYKVPTAIFRATNDAKKPMFEWTEIQERMARLAR